MRRSAIYLELDGMRLTLSEWAKRLGVSYITLYQRYQKGWPVEKVLQGPLTRGTTATLSDTPEQRAERAELRKTQWSFSYAGQWGSIATHAKIHNVPYQRARQRFYAGWDLNDIFAPRNNPPEATSPRTSACKVVRKWEHASKQYEMWEHESGARTVYRIEEGCATPLTKEQTAELLSSMKKE